jgi:PAS domain S-box-containing protein
MIKKDVLTALLLKNPDQNTEKIGQILYDEYDCHLDCVETIKQFAEYIKFRLYDVILAAGVTIQLKEAVMYAGTAYPEVPVLCIADTHDEKCITRIKEYGVADIVFSDNIARLPFAVNRAVRQYEKRFGLISIISGRFRDAQKLAHVGYCEYDAHTGELYLSEEVYRIYDQEPKTLKLKPGAENDCMQRVELLHLFRIFEQIKKELMPIQTEFWIERPDGTKKYLVLTGKPKTDANGELISIIATIQDISERVLAESVDKNRAEFEHTILSLAQDFINAPYDRMKDSIIEATRTVAEFCGVDRVFIYRYDWDKNLAEFQLEWSRKTEDDLDAKLETIALTDLDTVIKQHSKGRAFLWNSVDELPERSRVRQIANRYKMKSVCTFPMVAKSEIVGIIAFVTLEQHKYWTQAEVSAIEIFCQMMTSVLRLEENEKQLRSLNESYRLMLDSLDEGIGLYDRDGRTLNINLHMAERFGKTVEECLGINICELMRDEPGLESLSERCEKLTEVFDTGLPVKFVDNRDGHYYYNRLIPGLKNGRVTTATLITSDITDSKRAEEEANRNAVLEKEAQLLREIEHEYMEILDSSIESSWIIDQKTNYISYSSQWQRKLNMYAQLEEAGDPYYTSLIHPDDVERVIRERREAYEQKKARIKIEFRIKELDGQYRWYLEQSKLVLDEEGRPSKVYGTMMDITDRKAAIDKIKVISEDLAAEVEALKTIHGLYSNFIMQGDIDTAYKDILGAAVCMTGSTQGSIQLYEIINGMEKLRMVCTQGLGEEFVQAFMYMGLDDGNCGLAYKEKRRIISRGILHADLIRLAPSIVFLVNEGIDCVQSTPMITSSGKYVGVLNTYHKVDKQFHERELRMLDMLARLVADTTERYETEHSLQQSEKRALALVEELRIEDHNKNKFISGLSYELRNPLATIVAGLYLLNHSDDALQVERVRSIIEHQVNHLNRLVDDLLDFTRIVNNKIALKKERINLNSLAIYSVNDIKTQFDKKGVMLKVEISEPIYLDADPVRITQIIGNLLFNAMTHTENGGETIIRIYRENGDAVIKVKDSGSGFNPEILPTIFHAFAQVDNPIESFKRGFGLGLAIVKGIAELHRGSVSAYSEGPGKGSVITVRLPLHLDYEAEAKK